MTSLLGKVALITGGSQGIGRATARLLASRGCSVAINYSSNLEMAESLVAEIGHNNAIAIKANAGSIQGINEMVTATIKQFGKIDILIPNAATFCTKELADVTEDIFDQSIGLNVKGPFFLVQYAVPHMPPGSHIVLLSTSQCHASTVTPAYTLYTMTKGAIEQMTRVLAKDLGRKRIFVNAVAPGPTATNIFFGGKSPELLGAIAGWHPQNRIGQPDEIAEAIAYLSQSQWVSGQVLRVNGGMV